MSERETCWLVVENGEEFWGGNRTVPAITEAKRYIASEARVVAETLNAVFGGYDWQAVQHTFDPPKTPGQRFHDAYSRSRGIPLGNYRGLESEFIAAYELAAAEFLAGEPKAESVAEAVAREREVCAKIADGCAKTIRDRGKAAENAASTAAQRLQDQSVTNQQGPR